MTELYLPCITLSYDSSAPEDIYRQVDLYVPKGVTSDQLLVYVHGGAWLSGDKSEHSNIPTLLSTLSSNIDPTPQLPVIAIPNYRLSKRNDHPEWDALHPQHIIDVARSLVMLTGLGKIDGSEGTNEKLEVDVDVKEKMNAIKGIYLVGHSCGTHIVSHLAYNLQTHSTPIFPSHSLTSLESTAFTSTVYPKIKGYLWITGIYDLVDMVEEYKEYGENAFVQGAFGKREMWGEAFVGFEDRPLSESMTTSKHIIAHSSSDQLLTQRQSHLWYKFLSTQPTSSSSTSSQTETKVETGKDEMGGNGVNVVLDLETLTGDHDGCLYTEGMGLCLGRLIGWNV